VTKAVERAERRRRRGKSKEREREEEKGRERKFTQNISQIKKDSH